MSFFKLVTLLLVVVDTAIGFCILDNTACLPSSAVSLNMAENNQPEYGKSLEVPETYVRCGRCETSYSLKESDLGEKGRGRYVKEE